MHLKAKFPSKKPGAKFCPTLHRFTSSKWSLLSSLVFAIVRIKQSHVSALLCFKSSKSDRNQSSLKHLISIFQLHFIPILCVIRIDNKNLFSKICKEHFSSKCACAHHQTGIYTGKKTPPQAILLIIFIHKNFDADE